MMTLRQHHLHLLRALLLAAALVIPLALGASTAKAAEYGTFLPEPGSPGSDGIYNPDLEPFNNEAVAEQAAFACVSPGGEPITLADRDLLAEVTLAATSVYDGEFSFGDGAEIKTAGKRAKGIPENGGYPSGSAGMRQFIDAEQQLLRKGEWKPYTARTLQRSAEIGSRSNSYTAAKAGWAVNLGSSEGSVDRRQGERVAGLLPDDVDHPLELTADLPEACALAPLEPEQPSISGMLTSPGDFLLDELLYVPAKLSSAGFNFLQPYAFRYSFWTPHSERGDLIWDIPASCTPSGTENRHFSAAEINDACQGSTPLGFSQSNSDSGGSSWFVGAADFLQWLISGTYFLILFASAIVYMHRGNRAASLHVLRLVPRILLSIVLTIFAGVIIGALISVSNLAVQAIFDFSSAPTIGAVNTFLLQAGNIVGGPDLVQRLVQLLVGSFTVFFYLAFVVTALLRQLLLVGLVVLAPLAAICLVVPRWRSRFSLYARVLLVAVFLPVVLAFILKIGMGINPLLSDPERAYGSIQGLVGLILMMVTMWVMWRAIRLSKDYAIVGGSALVPQLPGLGRGAGERALDRISSGLSQRRIGADQKRADLVPGDRVSLGNGSADRPKLIPKALAAGAATPLRQSHPAGAPLANGNQAPQAVSAFQKRKLGSGGPQRIPAQRARDYRDGLRKAVAEAKRLKGSELDAAELEELKSDWANANGGQLKRRGGSWYLAADETPTSADTTAEQANSANAAKSVQ